MGRIRIRDSRFNLGGYYHFHLDPNPTYRIGLVGRHETCEDVVGNYPHPNPFRKEDTLRDIYFLNGSVQNFDGKTILEFSNFPCPSGTASVPPVYPGWGTALTTSQLQALGFEILAETNLSEPSVSLPTFIGEMKDFPSLVRDWGRSFLERAAKGWISWRWGIRPLIGDLRKLLDCTSALGKRMSFLNKVASGQRKFRRMTGLGSTEINSNWTSPYVIHSESTARIYVRHRDVHTQRLWGSVNYTVDKTWSDSISSKTDDEKRRLAYGLTYGISSYEALVTAWELTPWSWLIDWFGNIGTFLESQRNTVPVLKSACCVMRTSKVRREYEVTSKPSWCTVSGELFQERTIKERRVVTPIIPFVGQLPVITGYRWSILGSLLILNPHFSGVLQRRERGFDPLGDAWNQWFSRRVKGPKVPRPPRAF